MNGDNNILNESIEKSAQNQGGANIKIKNYLILMVHNCRFVMFCSPNRPSRFTILLIPIKIFRRFNTTDTRANHLIVKRSKRLFLLLIEYIYNKYPFAEEQWEKELDAELQEFEVVSGSGNGKSQSTPQSEDWEKDVEDLLGEENDDDNEDLK